MGFGTAVKTCMSKYTDFSGRARRSEYWWFYLFIQLVMMPFTLLFVILYVISFVPAFDSTGELDPAAVEWGWMILGFALMMIVSLVFLLPSYAASVRRLHDMGQSGWWVLLNFVGGGIIVLVMCIMDTQPHDNQWGPDPKAAERGHYGGWNPATPPPPLQTPPPPAPPQY